VRVRIAMHSAAWRCVGRALTRSAARLRRRSKFETRGLLLYVVLGAIVVAFTHAVKEGYPGGEALLWEFQKSGEQRPARDCTEKTDDDARLAGSCYLLGLIFYLDDNIWFSNALWHTCVLAGALSHWVILYRLVASGDERYPLV